MKKVLGLALLATLLATPAFAGETFVRNEDSWSNSVTNTDLKLDSKTYSNRDEKYTSWADKTYIDGNIDAGKGYGGASTISFDEFTVHTAGAELYGKYSETNYTTVGGTIKTTTNAYTDAHETSAGVR
ncbi:hypothetical protein NIES4072_49970 [Nostoc commune NIES-4072]|uniref:Uncharacterized protein n=1 Tax=Nostoc commune NIES-4072 TaxID=2005467 RepID=A0A2R5FYJ3_NOSCO|nr:hypothetical protein [Nostoc commune]BBD67705.1 hypothetical protein NIES4070_40980 [Nostoc commune HK-02]GBG21313.1 hypothetical protein NIES4072_49970 [Nostoc commune NIES-4072]